jgi:hypothetical protein
MLNKTLKLGLSLCLAAGVTLGQQDPPEPASKPAPKREIKPPVRKPLPTPPARVHALGRDERKTSERAIAAEPNVAIKLCVSEGSIRINGSERKEVRVFVRNGRKFEFRSLEKDPETGKANWLWIASTSGPGPLSNCLAGDSVDIDLPMGASIDLEARTAGAVVDSVKKAAVKIVEGSINLRNITGGVQASAYQGDVTVESSSGLIDLSTTTGNILAYDVKPGSVGDLFKATTRSGQISLDNVVHRQIQANSISGSVAFNGRFLNGGIYNFKTSNGEIRILIPEDSACRLVAAYGFGSFDTAVPIKYETQNVTSGGKNFVGLIGKATGAPLATVTVTTSSGSIGIRKQTKDLKL